MHKVNLKKSLAYGNSLIKEMEQRIELALETPGCESFADTFRKEIKSIKKQMTRNKKIARKGYFYTNK